MIKRILTISFFLGVILSSHAQYFGKNKPSYKVFNYEVYKTPHYEIYHYFKNDSVINELAQITEKWYLYHQQILKDTFEIKNPIIFYKSHGDFQQTLAINGEIEVGTGGVTEGMKNRVILPLSFTYAQTDHVIGHELVHAFQYSTLEKNPDLNLNDIRNIPLWMIEGMAEYLSLGPSDSQTTLWMRDALINDRFPTIDQMTVYYQFSPYRYGHAIWAYIGEKYGEDMVLKLFEQTAMEGYEAAMIDLLGISSDSLSKNWKNELNGHLLKNINTTTFNIIGKSLINKKNGGNYNLSPSTSPDGKKIIFLSEKDMFELELFLADAQTGEVIKKIYTSTKNDEIDALNFIESAGTWSPDSKFFAYVTYIKGKTALTIFNTENQKVERDIVFDSLDAISFPAWSPDGQNFAFSGIKEGVSDIYTYNINNKELNNITKNVYGDIQPTWSTDNQTLYYSTDEPFTNQIATKSFLNIGVVNSQTHHKSILKTFDGANNTNPTYVEKDNCILFLSDGDSRINLYKYSLDNKQTQQLTDYPTGISGMTQLSPAFSVAQNKIYYNLLWAGNYEIYAANLDDFKATTKLVTDLSYKPMASRIVPYMDKFSTLENNITTLKPRTETDRDSFYNDSYKAKFKLDYLGNMSGGVMVSRFGAGLAGSIEALFSDIVGANVLYSAVNINGEMKDIGGQVAYMFMKNRIKLGTSISHISSKYGYLKYEIENNSEVLNYYEQRIFEDKISVFTFFPFSRSKRVELGLSYGFYNYQMEKVSNFNTYDQIYSTNKERVPAPDGFSVGIIDAAYVIDNSKYGLASPIEGKRIRLQTERYLAGMNLQTILIDLRKYFYLNPTSFAVRLYHYGRYGKQSDNEHLSQVFIGYPWLVRGYDSGSFYGVESDNSNSISSDQVTGTRVIVGNMEFRIPFTGPKKIALINSNVLFSELALYIDGGITWTKTATPHLSLKTTSSDYRIPVFSTGVAYRVNLFGALVLEPYLAFPFHQGEFKYGVFGLNFFAGW